MNASTRQDALVRAMPAVFVLIWSTGFIVARYGMPHSPPMKFLAMRYFLSILCFIAWAVLSRARPPAGRRQVAHLAVTGVLMHAGYLGGVWAAVKLGMGPAVPGDTGSRSTVLVSSSGNCAAASGEWKSRS